MSSAAAGHYSKHYALAQKACAFLTASPDPFHAVANSVAKLQAAGFSKLTQPFAGNIIPGGKYYYTVNQSALVAFTVGEKYRPGNGFHIVGGHTDSPNLKVKPRSKKSRHGCVQLGVECYGGGLWHTWFDRDLGISGRVLVRSNENMIESKLINISDPVARISTLCIHLQTDEELKAFAVNKEEHTSPIVATVLEKGAEEQLNAKNDPWHDGHEPLLLSSIAEKLDIQVDQIADFELNLYDAQPASVGGISKEFINSGRLDNLATVFCCVEAIVDHSSSENLANDEDIAMIVVFDHEEVGSDSAQGAGAPIIAQGVDQISAAFGTTNPDLYASAIAKSFCLSIDQAHAIHPNYASKHESQHAPKMNAGVVIKTNGNQRYTTNAATGFVVRELARRAGNIPIQEFVVRNDCPCGSTIGPIISTRTGIRTVDAGMPQLSMHSCREVMGVADLTHGLELFKTFFKGFRELDNQMKI